MPILHAGHSTLQYALDDSAHTLFLYIVALTPVGEVAVCAKPWFTLELTCTADGALWSTSGFGEGLDDQMRVPDLDLANRSLRVTTSSYGQPNTSIVTLSNFNYGDHGATVTCEDHLQTGQQNVTLSVGKFEIQWSRMCIAMMQAVVYSKVECCQNMHKAIALLFPH